MKNKKFVFSNKCFDSLKTASDKATGWMESGDLKQGIRLYKIAKTYKLIVKFKEIK